MAKAREPKVFRSMDDTQTVYVAYDRHSLICRAVTYYLDFMYQIIIIRVTCYTLV